MPIIMELTNLKKHPGTTRKSCHLRTIGTMSSSLQPDATGTKVKHPGISQELYLSKTYYSRHPQRSASSLKRLVLALRLVSPGTIKKVKYSKYPDYVLQVLAVTNPPQSQEVMLGQCLTTVSFSHLWCLLITTNWHRWDKHHSAQSEPGDGDTRLSG